MPVWRRRPWSKLHQERERAVWIGEVCRLHPALPTVSGPAVADVRDGGLT